jgi:NNMT/PNMT/TEMT family
MTSVAVCAFDEFTPSAYLDEYYHSVFSENDHLLRFFAQAARLVPEGASILEYGGGPTVYQLISLAPRARSIHFTDYLRSNLDEVGRWLGGHAQAHDWRPFIRQALLHEGCRKAGLDEICTREALIRDRVRSCGRVDALDPCFDEARGQVFDVVSSSFVAESIAGSQAEWKTALQSICARVAPDGLLIMAAIRNAPYWVSGGRRYRSFPIDRDMLIDGIAELGFAPIYVNEIDAEVTDPGDPNFEGYDGMLFTIFRRHAARPR